MTQTQPLAIVFADVSGSTRLFEQLGDVEARRIIAAVLDALTVVVHRNGGAVIKTIGDEIMCTFPSALDGIRAACEMQRKVTGDPVFARDSIGIRIGMHHGEVLAEADAGGIDLIVIGSHEPGMLAYVIGSNASAIVRRAKCSVLVVR